MKLEIYGLDQRESAAWYSARADEYNWGEELTIAADQQGVAVGSI